MWGLRYFCANIFTLSLTIHTRDLIKTYSSRTVVDHVSVEVKQGEIVGLLGPNGAGKTTTFYMVVGLIKPDEGEVYLNDVDITKLPMYKRAQMGIGYLPQEASVFRKLSVEDNIMAVLEMTNLTKQERREKQEQLLDEFNLHHVVARLKYKNIGILITDHNVNETLSICDRAYLLIEGKIFKHGTAEELANNEQVRRLYLGTNFELKRKDWIINMGKSDTIDIDRIIHNLERAVVELDNNNSHDALKKETTADAAETQSASVEYNKYLEELRLSVIEYGEKTTNPAIVEKAGNLFKTTDLRSELNSLIDFLKQQETEKA